MCRYVECTHSCEDLQLLDQRCIAMAARPTIKEMTSILYNFVVDITSKDGLA